MSLSASPTVAAASVNYSADNYTALLQAGTAVPPSYTAPTVAFEAWKNANNGANNDKKFYLEKSGDSYKLGSVSGNDSVPDGAVAVDLNVAYGIESKEMSLVDWMMSRIGEEIRRDNALQAFGSVLSFAPEADVSFDTASMNQADLTQLLKRLSRASDDLRATTALGDAADRRSAAASLGLSASLLSAAMEQQRLFGEEAATLSTGTEAQAVGTAQSGLKDAKDTLGDATTTRDGAQTTLDGKVGVRDDAFAALEAAKAPGSKASEAEVKKLQAAYDQAVADVTTAQSGLTLAQTDLDAAKTAVAAAETAVTQAKDKYDAADNFNEVMSAALAKLVAEFTDDLAAAQLAYSQTAASSMSSSQLSGLTSAAGGALNSRLASAADLALLANPALALFSALDVQVTDDGYVVNTSGMSSRDAQKAAVRAALEEALNDPELQTALADAMAANADSLGTADMALPSQTQLYNEVAGAVISAMRANDSYLDELASGAVDFGNQLSQMLGNELVSASKRDNALMSGMN